MHDETLGTPAKSTNADLVRSCSADISVVPSNKTYDVGRVIGLNVMDVQLVLDPSTVTC